MTCGTITRIHAARFPFIPADREQLGANGVLGRKVVMEEDFDLKVGG